MLKIYKLKNITRFVVFIALYFIANSAFSKNPDWEKKRIIENKKKAEACTPATGKMDLDINNVRCRILTGGDMWWDLQGKAMYEIPKGSGKNSLFCASLWIAGVDVNNQLKCAAQRYRQNGEDYWPGPLSTDGTASVDPETCNQYDKHFKITRAEVDAFISDFKDNGKLDDPIPRSIAEWPAHGDLSKGQSYYLAPFYDNNHDGKYNPADGDYPYYDVSGNLCKNRKTPGTLPEKTMEGNGILSDQVLKGDQTLWWVFNDKGNIHTESGGDAIGMEIRAQAFAFATNDEINNMTFYSYELINRSTYRLKDTYFSQWIDPDLGYSYDDYVGCDVKRGLGYCYNGKAVDGTGRPEHYGDQPPAVGCDFFQGPYMDHDSANERKHGCDESLNGVNFGDGIYNNERFGMRRFVYYNNDQSVTGEPQNAIEYYNYLRGYWRDGTKMVYGGNAHRNDPKATNIECDFMFPGDSDPCDWGTGGKKTGFPKNGQYWTEEQAGNYPYDRRFMQSAGPFTLEPGAVNYITVGIPWARATSGGPFASVELLRQVDDKCQRLFDNCFQIIEGPDAPDLVIQELDKELILYLSNRKSNANANENFSVFDPRIISPDTLPKVTKEGIVYPRFDSLYHFEGYQIFQLANATVSASDLQDPDKARLVAQCDIKNGIKKLINYNYDAISGSSIPALEVDGADNGLNHTFKVAEDKFATGDRQLVNNKQYYFMAIAYAYNKYLPYSDDPSMKNGLFGQKLTYLPSRKNQSGGAIAPVTGIPHKTAPESFGTTLLSSYGETPEIKRIEGNGNGGRVLDLTDETINKILTNGSSSELTYQKNKGPVNIKIVDPLNVVPADYTLKLSKKTDTIIPKKDTVIFFNMKADTAKKIIIDRLFWSLTNDETKAEYKSDMDIEKVFKYYHKYQNSWFYSDYDTLRPTNEQLFIDLGLSVSIVQSGDNHRYSTNINGISCPKNIVDYQSAINQLYKIDLLESSMVYKDSSKQWLTGVQDADGITPWNWIRSGSTASSTDDPLTEDYYTKVFIDDNCDDTGAYAKYFWDPDKTFSNVINGTWAPAKLASCFPNGPLPIFNNNYMKLLNTYDFRNIFSVDVVITPDQSKWSRCPVVEMSEDPNLAEGNQYKFYLRKGKNVDKNGNPDGQVYNNLDYGMGWFPGYAINVETGERLNIMFGEDSWLISENGRDMKWNPTSNYTSNGQVFFGGKHYIYILGHNGNGKYYCPTYDQNQDQGLWCHAKLNGNTLDRVALFKDVMWIGLPMLQTGQKLLSSEVKIRIRVSRPYKQFYDNAKDTATIPVNKNYPLYKFSTRGMDTKTHVEDVAKSSLDLISVVPNPYYGFSEYETNQLDNRVKITNLPYNCTISIFTINGTLIRQLTKSDTKTYMDWDLKNTAGIPIAGGVYLIHIKADGIGEKVIKWFGSLRPVDLNNY